ncbi:MAG: hypothetical protein IH898_10490, partial [Planctomycetes bacterium]|nr:hypothetical protein [Planctomycetota bacterium]
TSGSVRDLFNAFSGSVVDISGGSVGHSFEANSGSKVGISGGEFRLNGALIGGLDTVGNTLPFNLPVDSVLSGTLADGTPFAFSSFDSIAVGTLTLEAAELPPVGPALIVLPSDPVPLGIRTGQMLIVKDDESLGPNFNAGWGSTVLVTGGRLSSNFEAVGAEVTIVSGLVGTDFDAFTGSVVDISGGSVGNDFDAFSGSEVNLFGTEFVLDGIDIMASLTLNDPFTITDRDVTLSGLLADGSPFSFDLNSTNAFPQDYFDPGALLTVTLVGPGDFDGNLVVDGADFLKWQRGESPDPLSSEDLAAWEANYGTGGAPPEPGDFDGNGVVDGSDFLAWQRGKSPDPLSSEDLAVWEANYGTSGAPLSSDVAAVPEPSCLLLLATAIVALSVRLNRVWRTA